MAKKSIAVLDTTLRDGMQGEGISYSVRDKLSIVRALDNIGIKYIEAGNPGSNPKDMEFFNAALKLKLNNSKLCAFGSTRRKNVKISEDPGIAALTSVDVPVYVIFGKTDELHVTQILNCSLEENLDMISDTVSYLKSLGKEVIYDAEHFFDGYARNGKYALKTLEAAVSAGADCIVLCDTNGGRFPAEINDITSLVVKKFGVDVGIHCHNDCGLAVADSISAVLAGAAHVQGTFLGFGERCGNARLSTLIPNLQLKLGYSCIPENLMSELTDTAHQIAEITNTSVPKNTPYVGRSAFAHKAGMHADGVLKNSASFEHVSPESVGNERRFLMSEMSGRSAIMTVINKIASGFDRNSPAIHKIIKKLKESELAGYQYEAAEASFELLVRKELGLYVPYFKLIGFKTIGEQNEGVVRDASAIIHVAVGDKSEMTAAAGDGPVHALDCALRKALEVFYPELKSVHLIDYKVRVLNHSAAAAAAVRVLITSTDGEHVWSTVGVSTDIIQASWQALVDSIEYKLIYNEKNGRIKN
ncbi:MAG: citramalate synthase [Clostridiales bacterium]|jgi:2-isopropylmalate synthase|nr:citramalate synthase [Clostridiales bacterium]